MRAERDPGHHAGGHPSPRPSARFGSGCGRAPVAPLSPPRRTPSRNASPSKSRPFGNTRSRPPLAHHQCVKVGVSQVRKSWCLLTPPDLPDGPPSPHPACARPGPLSGPRPSSPLACATACSAGAAPANHQHVGLRMLKVVIPRSPPTEARARAPTLKQTDKPTA